MELTLGVELLIGGLIILIGLAGRVLQQRTKLPDSIFLILFGVLLGPLLGLVPAGAVMPFLPFVSVIALIIIILESGLTFETNQMNKTVHSAVLLITLVGVFTTLFVGGLLHYVFGWRILHALLLGLISSGTTTLTARVLLESTNANPHLRRLITLETIFNDLTLIVGTIIILQFLQHTGLGLDAPLRTMAAQISIAVVMGTLVGWAWKSLLERVPRSMGLAYISTLGICGVLYYGAEAVGGSAVISIFAFALVLGNHEKLHRHFTPGVRNLFGPTLAKIKRVQGDISFFVRSFFFFLLGVSFSFEMLAGTVPVIVAIIIAAILICRYAAASIISAFDRDIRRYKMLVMVMIPRGFTATVLAFVPGQYGIYIPQLPEVVLLLVFATTAVSIGGTYLYNVQTARRAPAGGLRTKTRGLKQCKE